MSGHAMLQITPLLLESWLDIEFAGADSSGTLVSTAADAVQAVEPVLYPLAPFAETLSFVQLVLAARDSHKRILSMCGLLGSLCDVVSNSTARYLVIGRPVRKMEVPMLMQFLTDDAFSVYRANISHLTIHGSIGLDVLRRIHKHPSCLPNLVAIELDARCIKDRRIVPINVSELDIVGPIPPTARPTIVAARVKCLRFANVEVVDVANATACLVEVAKSSSLIRFTGRFPRMELLTIHNGTAVLNLSQCPRVRHIATTRLTPEHLTTILTAAPMLPRLPTETREMRAGAGFDLAPILAAHSPHLLPEYMAVDKGAVSWAPLVHRGFGAPFRHILAFFVTFVGRLADEGAVAQFDPAMLEDMLRHLQFRDDGSTSFFCFLPHLFSAAL